MQSKSIAFTEKLIDQDKAISEEMEKESGGFKGVPFVVITKEDGAKETIIGFNKGKINSILGIQE